ncbi:MAG: hypothetical protein JSS95_11695 [Acidobacteria bacterium]|nr:hypothetical protein [Acidobacteriota bacterium]
MIDKTDVRIAWGTPFSTEMEEIGKQLRRGQVAPFHPSRFYSFVGSLRETHNIDAILHLNYRGKNGRASSKLEIIDAGKKTILEMAQIIRRVFDIDPFQCELMRLDLASDISGVPVHVFRDLARFKYKRFSSRIEKSFETEMEFTAMGTADAQTFYAGRRPNFVRIYNKIKELYKQWLKLKQSCERFNKQMQRLEMSEEQRYYGSRYYPTFEEFLKNEGIEHGQGLTLTRIERQISGSRFPKELRLFGDLRRAHLFNPYASMTIMPSTKIRSFESPPKGVSIRDWLAAYGLNALWNACGDAQQAFSFVQKHGNGNGKRVLDSLLKILPSERPPITAAEILDSYVRSIERQQVGLSASQDILTP